MTLVQSVSWLARSALDRILRTLPTRRLQPPAEAHEPEARRPRTSKPGNFPGSHIVRKAANLLKPR